MRALPLTLLLTWASPAWALDWWVEDDSERQALETSLERLWPGHSVELLLGPPPGTGDAVWSEAGTLTLRLAGDARSAEHVTDPATQVVLVRSWLEAGAPQLPPPPPPPATAPDPRAQRALHAPQLLPGASGVRGAELAIGAAGTGSLDTDPLEGATQGYAPVVSAAVGLGRVQANATAWNLWEPERSHRPMGVAGLSVLVVDTSRWRLAPWVGAAGGWKQTEGAPGSEANTAFASAADRGFGGVLGAGASLEVSTDRLTWDLSLPIAGWMTWQLAEDADGTLDHATTRASRPALLLAYPEAGISWRLSDADTMRFGLLASVPSIRWRHDWAHAFTELSAATSVGLGQLGDGDLLLGGALYGRVGVQL